MDKAWPYFSYPPNCPRCCAAATVFWSCATAKPVAHTDAASLTNAACWPSSLETQNERHRELAPGPTAHQAHARPTSAAAPQRRVGPVAVGGPVLYPWLLPPGDQGRASLRQPDRYPEPRCALDVGGVGHDLGDCNPRHRCLGGCGGGHCRHVGSPFDGGWWSG